MADSPHDSLLGKIAAYTEILATDPRSTIFVSLSETYRKMGMLDDAYTVAVKGLQHLPDYCPGHVVLARIKCQQGDLDGSGVSFERALEFDPESLAALVGYSRLHLLQGRKSEARGQLLKARDLSPADPVINKLLLSLPESVEQPPAEVESVARPPLVLSEPTTITPPEPLESVTLAELYLQQGAADKALGIFRNLLARDPDNLELRRRIRTLEVSSIGLSDDLAENSNRPEADADIEVDVDEAVSDTIPPIPEPTDTHDAPIAGMSVLAQLDRLLASIQKRRGDVQGHA